MSTGPFDPTAAAGDDHVDPRVLAPSAVLDGEATDAEATLVDHSPELLAERDRYLGIQERIADVVGPHAAVRAAALAAAFAAADDVFGEPSAVTTVAASNEVSRSAPVVSLDARRRNRFTTRLLTGVAAAVVVGLVGVAAFSDRSTDNDSSTAAELPSQAKTAPDTAAPLAAQQSADQSSGAVPMADSAGAEADSSPAAAPGAEPAPAPADDAAQDTNSRSDDTAAAVPPSTIGTIGVGGASVATAPGETRESIASPAELRAYADARAGSTSASATTLGADCAVPPAIAVGNVSYQGVSAVVVRDPNGDIQALDERSCAVLATQP